MKIQMFSYQIVFIVWRNVSSHIPRVLVHCKLDLVSKYAPQYLFPNQLGKSLDYQRLQWHRTTGHSPAGFEPRWQPWKKEDSLEEEEIAKKKR